MLYDYRLNLTSSRWRFSLFFHLVNFVTHISSVYLVLLTDYLVNIAWTEAFGPSFVQI